MLHLVAAIKLGATAIGLASALVLGASAQAGIVSGHPHLDSSVSGSLFDGSQVLYPGSPAQARTTTLTFSGSATAGVVGLFAQNYQPYGPAALALCTAPDPGKGYDLTVSSDGAAGLHRERSPTSPPATPAARTCSRCPAAGSPAARTR